VAEAVAAAARAARVAAGSVVQVEGAAMAAFCTQLFL
tara:strand:- start:646 stop:756 length:111 start_codon:yes stop_codon:yes gene_type:complete